MNTFEAAMLDSLPPASRLKFIDNSKGENLSCGIEFFAVGLVISCSMVDGISNRSGKDYTVEFIDPFGQVQTEWRASEDITVSPIEEWDHENLSRAIDELRQGPRRITEGRGRMPAGRSE